MSFDNQSSYAAATPKAKAKTDWHAFLTYWVAVMASVAFGVLSFQLNEVRKTIQSHDKVIELQLRMNDSSMLVTERALALFESRQAAEKAREMNLRTGEE